MTNPGESVSGFGNGFVIALAMSGCIFLSFLNNLGTGKTAVIACIIAFFLSMFLNYMSQQQACDKSNIGTITSTSFMSVIATLFGFGIASIKICRIPVTSVVGPMIVSKKMDVVTGGNAPPMKAKNSMNSSNSEKKCCGTPQYTLDSVEMDENGNMIKAFSYSFYVVFAILFALAHETSIVTTC